MLSGKVDFSQLNDIAEYLQVVDCELFVDGLMVLKKHNDDNKHTD